MKRLFNKGYALVEEPVPVGPEHPVAAFYLTGKYADFERELPFPETSDPLAWDAWRDKLRARLHKILRLDCWGPVPDPAPQILAETGCDGYTRKKIAYETVPGNWAVAYLLVPDAIDGPVPAMICLHGHFGGGKDSVVCPDKAAGVAYGHEFARQGFVVLAPDNAGMSTPKDYGTVESDVPGSFPGKPRQGGCDLLFRRLNHMGLDITGFRIFELMTGLNILCGLKEVDNSRLGCAGLSGGCWLAQVLTALDARIKAVILSGFFTTFVQTTWLGHCICHHPHGIGRVCDLPDISASIAPRPQFVESGKRDTAYPVEPAYSMVRRAYRLQGAEGNLALDSYDGSHMFHGAMSIPWMIERLAK